MAESSIVDQRHVSLCEMLDRVLNKGAVISGEIAISVADVELIHLSLQLLLASASSLTRRFEDTGEDGPAGEVRPGQ